MKNFKKMILLPYENHQTGGEFTAFTQKDEKISKLKNIDQNMDSLLRQNMPTDTKLAMYNQFLSTFNEILGELRNIKKQKTDLQHDIEPPIPVEQPAVDAAVVDEPKLKSISVGRVTNNIDKRIRPRARVIGKLLNNHFKTDDEGLLVSNEGHVFNTTPKDFLRKTSLKNPKHTPEIRKVLDFLESTTPQQFHNVFQSSDDIGDNFQTPKSHVYSRSLNSVKRKDLSLSGDVIKGVKKYRNSE